MLRRLDSSETVVTGPFGGFCPYWTMHGGQVLVADTAEEIIEAVPTPRRTIDPVAVVELLQFNYMLGDRTLIRDIWRMPWHSTLTGTGQLIRRPPIPHDVQQVSPPDSARQLIALLEEELLAVAQNHPKIWLLLTGGLDSRVVAGILKRIESRLTGPIACVTWGLPDSRDVAYARQIATWYDWPFFHIPYDQKLVWDNLQRGAIWGGGEVSGIHLHNMHWFHDKDHSDLVIASSFGDSVGRAEFSSIRLSALTLEPVRNAFHLIKRGLAKELLPLAEQDRATAWQHAQPISPVVAAELDQQENYMRRMICHIMDYIRQFCTLYQAFTSESVVGYMWSLSPDVRTDDVYVHTLQMIDRRLYSLPWARDGIALDGTVEPDPTLRKDYHTIPQWLHSDLRDRLADLIFSPNLQTLGIFNQPAIVHLWERFTNGYLPAGVTITKLCTIEIARQHFHVQPYAYAAGWQDSMFEMAIRGLNAVKRWQTTTRKRQRTR
jgi:hypothetical protein